MLKKIKMSLLITTVAMVAGTSVSLLGHLQTVHAAGAETNIASALPDKKELLGYDNYRTHSSKGKGIQGSNVSALRKSDKTGIKILALVGDTEADAHNYVYERAVLLQQMGPFAKGSVSGQKIGDECWNSDRNGGLVEGDIQIYARKGRAVVSVSVTPTVKRDKRGLPNPRALMDAKDVAWAEKQAIKVLSKLSKGL